MPLPFAAFLPLVGQAVSSLGSMATGIGTNRRNIAFQREANQQNIAFQRETNVQNMDFQREMYGVQRRDALADYAMQNDYNSPTSQMSRLRESGLNPNLVYGNGVVQNAAPVRQSTPSGASLSAPKVYAPQVSGDAIANAFNLSPYFQMQNQAATYDNLKAQNSYIKQQEATAKANELKSLADAGLIGQRTTGAKVANQLASAIVENQIIQASLKTKQMKSNIQFTDDSNERAFKSLNNQTKQTAENILRSSAERGLIPLKASQISSAIQGQNLQNALKDVELQLRQTGLNPNDPTYQKYLVVLIRYALKKFFDVDVNMSEFK